MSKEPEVEMFVAGLVLDPGSNAPIVVLKDLDGNRALPIWIGLPEATAIASALKGIQVSRPMTHDLLVNTIQDLGGSVVKVTINGLNENTFIASIEIVVGEVLNVIDARPSDALALAVRVNCPIFVKEEVLTKAEVAIVQATPDMMKGDEADLEADDNDKAGGSANFANIDKEKWSEILAEMDPDDFKYKM